MKKLFSLSIIFLAGGLFTHRKQTPPEKQFVLVDVTFTYSKQDADSSTPSKSHYTDLRQT